MPTSAGHSHLMVVDVTSTSAHSAMARSTLDAGLLANLMFSHPSLASSGEMRPRMCCVGARQPRVITGCDHPCLPPSAPPPPPSAHLPPELVRVEGRVLALRGQPIFCWHHWRALRRDSTTTMHMRWCGCMRVGGGGWAPCSLPVLPERLSRCSPAPLRCSSSPSAGSRPVKWRCTLPPRGRSNTPLPRGQSPCAAAAAASTLAQRVPAPHAHAACTCVPPPRGGATVAQAAPPTSQCSHKV